jgi:hypothetical protein
MTGLALSQTTSVDMPSRRPGALPRSERALTDRSSAHIREHGGRYFARPASKVHLIGDPDVDYWSIMQRFRVCTVDGHEHTIFCKWPKARWDLGSVAQLHLDPQAEVMARTEFAGLQFLWRLFARGCDPTLNVVRPLDLLEEPFVILSEGVDDSIELFRDLLKVRSARSTPAELLRLVRGCGRWLALVHGQKPPPSLPNTEPFDAQLTSQKATAECLTDAPSRRLLLRYIGEIKALTPAGEAAPVVNVEGFEIRNFIHRRDTLFFLDPGQLSVGSRYEDVARFLVSLPLLHWGRARLLLPSPAEQLYAAAFLEGYQDSGISLTSSTLRAYLAKQYLKWWLHGLDVLAYKNYSRAFRWFGRRVYLPWFCSRRIDQQLRA